MMMWGKRIKKATRHSKTERSTRKTAVPNKKPLVKPSGAVKIWKEQGERWGTCVNLVLAKQHTRGITKITQIWRKTHSASAKRSVPVHKVTTTTYQTTIYPERRHAFFVVVVVESFDGCCWIILFFSCRCTVVVIISRCLFRSSGRNDVVNPYCHVDRDASLFSS